MKIDERIPLLDRILEQWQTEIGKDFAGYRNHVYRMVNFCFALHDCAAEEREKIIVAGCFHDLGIWSHKTFDYLPPSIGLAKDYLQKNAREAWIPEIESMIAEHHKIGNYRESHLTEVFRRGDLIDFSLGFVKCGLPKPFIKNVRKQFPNRGFHKCLVTLAGRWFLRHPLDPVPVLKW